VSRLAGTRAKTLAALVYGASESTPSHAHAELDLCDVLEGGLLCWSLIGATGEESNAFDWAVRDRGENSFQTGAEEEASPGRTVVSEAQSD
jgi:hypothetical protein